VSATLVELRSPGVAMQIAPSEGGRIVSLIVGDEERILPKARAGRLEPPIGWGCFAMVPWAGRLGDGRIPTRDGEVRLDLNLPPSSIHGLVFDRPWDTVTRSDTSATMRCELAGRGWPFGGDATQTLTLSPTSLDLQLEVGGYTRAGPAGLGWHPWFARPAHGDLELRLDAARVLVVDADLVPTGEVHDVTGDEDLRAGPALGDRRLDHVYIDAKAPVIVRWPDLDLRIEFGASLKTVVVHTPPEGICVEPQTMWPHAPVLASRGVVGTGLRTLEPGERTRSRQRWTWSARADSPTRLR
jgi:aldose 1-epimerase